MKYTAHEFIAARATLVPASYSAAAAANSTEIDTKGYRELLYIFHLGAFAAGATVFFQCQECATSGGSYTDITSARAPATSTYAATGYYVGRIELMKRLRYHEVQYDVEVDAVIMSISAVLLDAVELPATQTNTNVFSV